MACPRRRMACAQLGWPVVSDRARPELVTGTVIDALQIPRAAGQLAISWWLDTGGLANPVRHLPAMPRPDQALAVDLGRRELLLSGPGGRVPVARCRISAGRDPRGDLRTTAGRHSCGGTRHLLALPRQPRTAPARPRRHWRPLPLGAPAIPGGVPHLAGGPPRTAGQGPLGHPGRHAGPHPPRRRPRDPRIVVHAAAPDSYDFRRASPAPVGPPETPD